MNTTEQINEYLNGLPEAKRSDMLALHQLILDLRPQCTLWYLDGKNSEGKIVSNPNIGYGKYEMMNAVVPAGGKAKPREFYQVGISSNTSGISVYIMGIADKTYLPKTFGSTIGKASVTGYCIKFKAVRDINLDILLEAIRYGFEATDSESKVSK